MNHWTHNLDPTLLHAGPITIRWYGFMYLVGFIIGLFLMIRRYKKGLVALDSEESQVLISYLMIGMMICARLFYCLVYNPNYFWAHPGEIIQIWQGGLSFHGAAIGFILAMLLYARQHKVEFYHVTDSVVFGAAQGIFWGRIGNFINGELWGRATDVPWAVIFPLADSQPRHPSQLYQGLLEGIAVFVVLYFIERREIKKGFVQFPDSTVQDRSGSKKKKTPTVRWHRTGVIGSSFLILYGLARFIVEFFREPDAQLGYFGGLTMGQILCFIMILGGSIVLRYVIRRPHPQEYPWPS